jgi:hypothetical protein
MVERTLHGHSAEDGRQCWPLVREFLDYLRKAGTAPGYLQEFPGPVKHLLVWLDRNGVGLDTMVGPLAWGSENLPPFAAKNVAKTPLVGGQWRKRENGWDLVIVDNQTAPNIPAGGTMEAIG